MIRKYNMQEKKENIRKRNIINLIREKNEVICKGYRFFYSEKEV